MRNTIFICLILGLLLTLSSTVNSSIYDNSINTDFDPLVDITVTVEIKAIRYLEKEEPVDPGKGLIKTFFFKELLFRETGLDDNPSFYVKVFINEKEYTSNIWSNTKYIYTPDWSVTSNVPDDEEFVNIKIQLLDSANNDAFCDISPDEGRDAEMIYSVKTGHWTGDDALGDKSGYGRLCGTDDGKIYENDKDSDCELWFDIYQNDYDGDTIPYWTEVNTYGTDPKTKNSGDPDNDKIPVEWEYKWGYNPFIWEDHANLDPDSDSINNYEEYLTSEWFSDPYRKDVFVEMDKMADGPNGEKTYFPVGAKELIQTAFDRQNIIYHLDMGEMGGYDLVPFLSDIGRTDLNNIYYNYFLHKDEHNWRRGVFHYGLVVYYEDPCGYMFRSNAYQIASTGMEKKLSTYPYLDKDIVYGSAYMHELGHTFNFNPIPGHNRGSYYPWQAGYWLNLPYKSCMNYVWMYRLVDYSDGSLPSPDIDDWSRIDYHSFEMEWG
ncbi:MAG: hypothetical protein MUO82_00675 [Candidatus Thermoplasmatota archaeon]|nr:hypothetical protein [Candidatus Thermoplasmatota archaeon]